MNRTLLRTLLLPLLLLGLAGVCAPVHAGAAGTPADLERQSQALARLLQRYQAAPGDRTALQGRLHAAATARSRLQRQLLASDPAAVLRTALPAALRAELPAELSALLEQEAEVAGTLEVRFVEGAQQAAQLAYAVAVDGRSRPLHLRGTPPALVSGTPVRLRGLAVGDALAVDAASGLEILAAGSTATTDGSVAATPLVNTFGEQRTALLLVNFQNQVEQPITPAAADALLFGTVSDFMRENSYGQTWLAGGTVGWLTLPINATCSTTDITNAATATAAAAGIDLSGYGRLVYFFPRNSACTWDGQGTVGGTPSRTWINGVFDAKTVGHEFGHNLGLYHSHALECGSSAYGDACQSYEYGDTLDAMGNKVAGHFNAFQKARLGWLGYNLSPPLTTVAGSGSYSAALQELPGQAAKGLRIPRGSDPVSGQPRWLVVEYRQAVGFDSFLAGNANVLGGVVVHAVTDGDANSSQLLDLTPGSSTYFDWNDPALMVGRSFTDPLSGVTLTPAWADSAAAMLNVTFGQPACVRAAPLVAVTPGQGPWVAPGSAVDFLVSVTSQDSSACSAADLALATTLPAGWSGSLAPATLSLAPGASAAATLRVVSAAGATDGFYAVTVSATPLSASAPSASASASYVVSAPAVNHPPVAVADSATTATSTAVRLLPLANDSDPDGDPLSVSAVSQPANGTATLNADGSITYLPKRRFTGSDTFRYTASDGQAGATASITITVGSTSSGGRTKK